MAAGDTTLNLGRGNFKRCAVFDGVDDYVTIDNPINNLSEKSYTISLWLKTPLHTSNVYSEQQVIITTQTVNYNSPKFVISLRNSNILFRYQDGVIDKSINTSQVADEWINLIAVFSQENNRMEVYINSEFQETTNLGTAWLDLDNTLAYIGKGHDLGKLKGCLANIQIFEKELSEAERTKLYQGSPVTDGLVSHWKLDKDYKDSVGSNDGTNSGTRLAIIDDEIAADVKAARTSANDKQMLTSTNSRIVTATIEEA